PADHFRIGSNTKTFVISVLLQLVGEKKLSLDDPLSRFPLGVTIPNAEGITVRELCDMRSGLFEAYGTPQFAALNMKVPENFDPRTLVAWAVQQKPYFAPGKGYRYSNTNYLLIGMIIEEITKDSVGNQIRKRLLEPIGLKQTSYPETEAMPSPWVHGYHLDKQGNWEDISNTIPVAFMGSAGAMISDMNDIRRWIELYATGKTIGAGSYQDLINCIPFLGNTSFGLGITCSEGWYGYTGALPGYNTADYYSPATGTTILAWINYQAKEPGYGGAITAARLANAPLNPKLKICVLERGQEWPIGSFPDTIEHVAEQAYKATLNPLGLYQMDVHTAIVVLRGSGLGGTSLVNANVAIRPEPDCFDTSPAAIRHAAQIPERNAGSLWNYYRRAESTLGVGPHPNGLQLLKNQALQKRATELGKEVEIL